MKTLARQGDKAEVLRRLRTVSPESPRRWGRMSAHQMVCHLADAFRMITGQKPVKAQTHLLKRTLLTVRWPSGILTCPEIDQEQGGTRPVEFALDVAQVEALLAEVAGRRLRLDRQLHPLFGRMSEAAWLRWGYLHMDHHLRQFGA